MHLLILHERRFEVVNIYTILLQRKLYVKLKHFNYMYLGLGHPSFAQTNIFCRSYSSHIWVLW